MVYVNGPEAGCPCAASLLQLFQRLVQEGLPTYCVLRVCPLCFCSRADSLLLHPETSTLTSAGSRTGSAQAGVRGVCKRTDRVNPKSVFTRKSDLPLSTVIWKQCKDSTWKTGRAQDWPFLCSQGKQPNQNQTLPWLSVRLNIAEGINHQTG